MSSDSPSVEYDKSRSFSEDFVEINQSKDKDLDDIEKKGTISSCPNITEEQRYSAHSSSDRNPSDCICIPVIVD